MVALTKRVLCVFAVVSLGALGGAAQTFALSPWWHLTSGARPSHLHYEAGLAAGQDEVQELVVRPETVFGLGVSGKEVGAFETVPGPNGGALPAASVANIQAALETAYGANNVLVTERSGGTAAPVLEIKSVGADAEKPVPPVEVTFSEGSGATVGVVTKGKYPQTDGEIVASATNLGDAGTGGEARVLDGLPAGLRAVSGEIELESHRKGSGKAPCVVESSRSVACGVAGSLAPYAEVEVIIGVVVEPGASSGEVNRVSAVGGGAPAASIERPIVVSDTPAPFGVETYELTLEEEGGGVDTQAGSHPFQVTSTLTLNQTAAAEPVSLVKDLNFRLPPGLVGNATVIPQCTLRQFLTAPKPICSPQSVVGVASVLVNEPKSLEGLLELTVPLFNLEPAVGEPARFGFAPTEATPVVLDTSVRTGGDYGVTVSVDNITQEIGFIGSKVTFWGVPGDPRHDQERDGCLEVYEGRPSCTLLGEKAPPSFLQLPTACSGSALQTSVEADPWKQEGAFGSFPTSEPMATLDGCNRLPFEPSIRVTPDGQAGSTPTGLTVDEHVPQETDLNATGLAESGVKGLSVTLPEGVALNPAGADGLQACSEEQIGLQSPEATGCPEAAKVGTVKVKTPLLPNPLEGAAYLAMQNTNPFGSLVALYVYAEDPVSGIRAKATGEVLENPVTGQLTSHFEGNPVFENDPAFAGDQEAQFLPELPYEDIELHFFGGDRAPLVTPAKCGSYTTTGTFTPWSGTPTTESASTFDITSGPNGGPCRDPLPFDPTLTTGTTSIQAGGFTPFEMTMSREDGEQALQGVQTAYAAGALRAADGGEAVRRRTGGRGDVRPGKPDRGNDCQCRRRRGSVHGQGREGVSDRPLQGRPVRPVDREPGEGGPVRPGVCRGPREDRSERGIRGVDGHDRR